MSLHDKLLNEYYELGLVAYKVQPQLAFELWKKGNLITCKNIAWLENIADLHLNQGMRFSGMEFLNASRSTSVSGPLYKPPESDESQTIIQKEAVGVSFYTKERPLDSFGTRSIMIPYKGKRSKEVIGLSVAINPIQEIKAVKKNLIDRERDCFLNQYFLINEHKPWYFITESHEYECLRRWPYTALPVVDCQQLRDIINAVSLRLRRQAKYKAAENLENCLSFLTSTNNHTRITYHPHLDFIDAKVSYQNGDFSRAIILSVQALIHGYNENDKAYSLIASSLISQEKFDEAEIFLLNISKYSRSTRFSSDLNSTLGNLLCKRGKYEQAAKLLLALEEPFHT